MGVTVYIPTPFRRATGNRDRIEVSAPDVGGLLDELERSFAGLKGLVRDDKGEVFDHVNIYVNSEAIEALEGLQTPLRDGDEVTIIPALAGGRPVILTAGEVGTIQRQAAEEYPNECCGVIVARGDERQLLRFRNIQDELHAQNPQRYPRTARTAYNVGKPDLDRLERAQSEGFRLVVAYHSHIDVGAYFSETDKRMAMLGQDPNDHEPLYPDATQLVVSVVQGRVEAVAAFRWDSRARDFLPVDLNAEGVSTSPAQSSRWGARGPLRASPEDAAAKPPLENL